MSYATNPNNLRLALADFLEEQRLAEKAAARARAAAGVSLDPLPTTIDPADIIR
jgi:hypothetical protein